MDSTASNRSIPELHDGTSRGPLVHDNGDALLPLVIEQSALATCVCDSSGRVLAVNQAMTAIFGFRLEDLPAAYSVLEDPQVEAQGLLPFMRRAFAGEPTTTPPLHYDLRRTKLSGQGRSFWVRVYLSPLREPDGRIQAVVLTALDVTDLKETEEALRASEQQLAVALDAGRMGTFSWDVTTGVVTWSPALERLHGYEPGTFPRTLDAYLAEVHPDDRARLEAMMPELLAGQREHHQEYRIVRTDGSVRWVEGRGTVLRDEAGRPLRVAGVCADITARKQGERDLQRLAAIVQSSRDAIISKNLDGTVTSWNPSAERIFGYSAEEMIGQSIYRLIPEALHGNEHEMLQRVAAGEIVESFDATRIRKDGREVIIAVTISPLYGAGGAVIGTSSIKRDVTEQREVQETLRRSEARYRSLIQATSAGVWNTRLDGEPDEGIGWWCALTGQTVQEAQNWGWIDAVHPEDRAGARATWEHALAAETVFQDEYRVRTPAGAYRHVRVRGVPVPAAAVREWIGTYEDVTEQREADERLRQAAKMEAIGRLAGGLAHDFNNQLHALTGFASFVAHDPGLGAQARQDLAEIQKAAERMATLTRQLLAFSRKQVLAPETLDLNAAVADSQSMLQRLIGSNIEMRVQLEPGPRWVRVDRAQLLQILLNLAVNARDALPEGGQLTFHTATRRILHPQTHHTAPGSVVTPGVYAELRISDTGTGIAPEHLAMIFEPFFTTKEIGQGTGLGLATVHGIVTQSHGHILVDSTMGAGTAFTILLPLVDAPVEADHLTTAPGAHPRETARILVVDDEPAVLAIAARELGAAGYAVLSAENGRGALRVLEQVQGGVDAVVSDIVMPVMGGRELAAHLARTYPGIPVIWTSGYPLDTLGPDYSYIERHSFLQKPVHPELLLETVRAVLARRGR